jgi:lipopolysaccharide heptosyltransferase II
MKKSPEALRILVARPDRLGDVVLSTPVFAALRRHYPRARISALVREGVAPVIRGLSSVDEVLIFDPEGRHSGLRGLFRLARELRERHFRIGVVLQSHWKIALALFLARIAYRVGPLSKLHSFLFYNRGVRQRRSLVEMHEADYNLQLLRRLGVRVSSRSLKTDIAVSQEARLWAEQWAREQALQQGLGVGQTEPRPWVGVHPGMAGSALNWPESHYIALIQGLSSEGYPVLVTGGPTEAELLARIRAAVSGPVVFYGGREAGSVDRLAALIERCAVFVAPSTGPLHLAVALGKPVISFYPPIRVQSVVRWGPYVEEDERRGVLVPDVFCGEDFTCRGSLCNYYPCMKSLTVAEALQRVHEALLRVSRVEHAEKELS